MVEAKMPRRFQDARMRQVLSTVWHGNGQKISYADDIQTFDTPEVMNSPAKLLNILNLRSEPTYG